MEVDAGVVGEPGGDGQRVGDHGERDVDGDGRRQTGDRAAGVEDDAAAVGEFGQRGGRDAVLLVGRCGLALGEVRLEGEAACRDGPSVHPPDQAGPVEGREVAAYGLGGHVEPVGKGEHVDTARLTGEEQDLLAALRCVHVGLRPFHARICDFGLRYAHLSTKTKKNGHAHPRRAGMSVQRSGTA